MDGSGSDRCGSPPEDPPGADVIDFSSRAYWESKYQGKNELYEWFQPWSTFRSAVLPLLANCSHILNVGCGNSPMSFDMLADGFRLVESIDISETVIAQMQQRYAGEARLKWAVMDSLSLDFPDSSFDAVIEKGVIDAFSTSSIGFDRIRGMLQQIARVLKPRGVFIAICYGSPTLRLPEFQREPLNWKVAKPIQVPKIMVPGSYYYVYSAVKPPSE
jgi:ubiquinone/menaquinone biosynthesis C-methylase UbiE